MRLEELIPGLKITGVVGQRPVEIVSIRWHGRNYVTVTHRDGEGHTDQTVLGRDHEERLQLPAETETSALEGDPQSWRLVAEALRIRYAALSESMMAITTSDMEPLPHQITAVYEELLPRSPLRFLLADDPGSGKTIMAGLYIKELMLRGDLARCLVVAPGSLVEQWQEELWQKLRLRFQLLTRSLIDATIHASVFDEYPLLIAKMDQLSRNDNLIAQLGLSDWDLVVVDEAHRMSAHYFGNELKTTKRYQLGQVLRGVTRHFLLMTATPHAGKQDDFELFLSLLDNDRFEGRHRAGSRVDTRDLMRRMVKEDLLTMEGRPLFPERRASTVPYELSPEELAPTTLSQSMSEQE